MNKDQVKGRATEAAGKAKEVAGKIIGSKTTEEKGRAQKNVGKTQAAFGDLKNDIKQSS